MTASVKIKGKDKTRLDKLQALVALKVGRKVTQQELLSILIQEAYEHGDEFISQFIEDTPPLSEEQYQKILSLVEDWKVQTKWGDVDQLLYGNID